MHINVSTSEHYSIKHITLLLWDLENQFGIGYWAISYYKHCKLVESCL